MTFGRLAMPVAVRHLGLGWLLCFLGVVEPRAADGAVLAKEAERDFRRGAFTEAAAGWAAAERQFREAADTRAEVGAGVELALTYQAMGHYRRALQALEELLPRAEATGDLVLATRTRARLGALLVLLRQPERAGRLLEEARAQAKTLADPGLESEILNDLGNHFAAEGQTTEALELYRESAELARQVGNRLLAAQALGNAAAAALRGGETGVADEHNREALEASALLPPSHATGFLLLGLGQTDGQLELQAAREEESDRLRRRAYESWRQALEQAEAVADVRLQTYALGLLAGLYERDGQTDAAMMLVRRAAFLAQQAQLPEALYRWEWLTGRLHRARGEWGLAVAAYRRAVETLEPIRSDLVLGYGNALGRYSFRETEGPLFLELADLLLHQASAAENPEEEQSLLVQARDAVERLKAVELEDYFCDDCVDVQRASVRRVEAVDDRTAVLYLILFPERTDVLVGLRSGLKRFTVGVGGAELTGEVNRFRRNLETRTTFRHLEQGRQLYDWLIRPVRGWLLENGVDTLVMVPDGALRTIPLAALHDGRRFLIEEFAVAVAPGLSLVEPKPLRRGQVRMLRSGLSAAVQGFPPLEFVPAELAELEGLYTGATLFNEGFTLGAFQSKLGEEQFSIVHIASHGQFDRDVRNTFVLTYDRKLTLNGLEALIRPSQYRGLPVELLVLSACQTAAGDERAALGLAGVAVKAGARSALATLWFVNDRSTAALVSEVYQQLRSEPTRSKAQALRAAQLKLLGDRRYRHPCYWSPFLIIGNWL